MSAKRELVMYGRTTPCPYITIAKRVLSREKVPYRELHINTNPLYERRVREWTGFLSVPTLIIAEVGQDVPYQPPAYLAPGDSPRGVNRGSMITEASEDELVEWLRQHDLLPHAAEAH
jgi:glutaredoxin